MVLHVGYYPTKLEYAGQCPTKLEYVGHHPTKLKLKGSEAKWANPQMLI